MNRSRKILAGWTAAAVILAGTGVGVAHAAGATAEEDEIPRLEDVVTSPAAPELEGPQEQVTVFSADARINGHRIDDEWYIAVGQSSQWPGFGSVWLLTDAEADEWAPLCFGLLLGDENGMLFVGESLHGDPDEGCMILGLGDDAEVFFGAVELEGDEVLTTALYPLG